MPIKVENMIGKTYNLLTVLEYDCQTPGGQKKFRCKCVCGNITSVASYDIRAGKTKSCGCLKHRGTHKMTNSSEYKTWCGIKSRCNYESGTAYRYYGGRGIKICEEWNNSFEAFYKYIGPKPGPEYSIDRIDCDGNYEPDNVRWATPSEQLDNRKARGMTLDTLQYKARSQDTDRRTSDNLTIATLSIAAELPKLTRAAQTSDLEAAKEALRSLLLEIAEAADILDISLETLVKG